MAGGQNVDSERIASLETKMDMVLETVREIKRDVVTKAEHSALHDRVKRLEEDGKHKQAMVVAWISAVAAVGSVLYMVMHK